MSEQVFILNLGLDEEKNMASKTNEGVVSSVVLTPIFGGTDFEYWKIRMRTHLKAEGLWTIVANDFEEPDNDGDLIAAEMKNLEAKYRQDAKALSKNQWESQEHILQKLLLVRLQRKLGIFWKLRCMVTKRYAL